MKRQLLAALLIAMPLAAQATGYHYPPRPPIVRPPVVTPTAVTPTQPAQPAQQPSGGHSHNYGPYVMAAVAIYFTAVIWTHAACVADEDKRKVPDNKRTCYKHKP